MGGHKNPRLAFSEYVTPDNRNEVIQQARRELMRCVREVFPQMLKQLSAEVFPAFEALALSDFNVEAILWHSRLSPFKELPNDSALRAALWKWATQFNAEQDWFLDEMLRTLRGWHVAADWRIDLKCNPIGGVTSILAMGEHFTLDCHGWEMQRSTWADYSRLVREQFEQKLSEYEASSRKLAESCGLKRALRKYSRANLQWFVLFQFAGLSSKQIADQVSQNWGVVDESSILKGVKTAKRLIGWDSPTPMHRRSNRKIR